jgi:hypothetical protein
MGLRRVVQIGATALLAAAAVGFPLAGAAWAPKGPNWKAQVPFTETIFDSATGESVALAGTSHITIWVTGNVILGWNVTLKEKLLNTTGVGSTSGGVYRTKGVATLTAQLHPGPPIPATFPASFRLHPPNPCHTTHLCSSVSVPVTATFNADGTVAGVQVGHSD